MTSDRPAARTALPTRWAVVAALTVFLAVPGQYALAQTAAHCGGTPAPHTLQMSRPLNIGELKLQVRFYACSGAYDSDIAKVLADTRAYVKSRAAEVARPAIVLDIDETALSNFPVILANDFGYIPNGKCDDLPKGPCGVNTWELSGRAEAIAPTLALFRAARAHNVAVFFITGRHASDLRREKTAENLKKAGYEGWSGLVLRPGDAGHMSTSQYKSGERAKIAAQGYTIIANVGDQQSDLAGGYAERAYKLPNPFYFIP